jgi:hypothetical protein
MKQAFKEWAVICQALATGRQALILRKGGIAETGGVFRPEHGRFWLYPTYLHQQEHGVSPAGQTLLRESERDRPPAGTVRISHFVEVPGVYHVRELGPALLLGKLHLWSDVTVKQRFEYRGPGLYVLPARVYRARETVAVSETEYYAGCKSWVELEKDLPTDGAVPVLSDAEFRDRQNQIEAILQPTALA